MDLSSTTDTSTASRQHAHSECLSPPGEFGFHPLGKLPYQSFPSAFSNKINRHFHCTRPNCGFSFVRYSTMAIHDTNHSNNQDIEKIPNNTKEYENERASPNGEEDIKLDSASSDVILSSPAKTTGWYPRTKLNTISQWRVYKCSSTFF